MSDEMREQRNYFAVIPARILHDQRLSSTSKLLYGEISARCNEKGYCWATNATFAKDLRVGERSVTRLISELEQVHAIRVEFVALNGKKATRERRIYIGEFAFLGVDKIGDIANFGGACVDKNDYPSLYCNSLNNTGMNNMPGVHRSGAWKSSPKWNPERFEKFWAYYRSNVRGEARSDAVKAWDKLKPDDELLEVIGKALVKLCATEAWKRGIGKPYASTFLNSHRWEDADELPNVADDDDEVRLGVY